METISVSEKQAGTADINTFDYAANSEIQRLVYKECEKYLPDLKGRQKISIVDYGCGVGQNWTHGLELLLAKADDDTEFQIVLNDGLRTDWNAVAQVVEQYRTEKHGMQRGHFAVLPGNFYRQLMPKSSVDVGVAWNSFHWMEQTPPPVNFPLDENWVVRWQASIRPQGHADLIKLLRLRAREFKPGGHLLLVIPTLPSSSVKLHLEALVIALRKCLQDGIMSPEQYHCFSAPYFQPTEGDFMQIMSTVQDLWHLPQPSAFFTLPHPAWTRFEGSQKTEKDHNEYGECMVGWIMAVFRDILLRAFRYGDTRERQSMSTAEHSFVEEFKSRYKQAILGDPLIEQRAESSFLVVRLVRKASDGVSGSKAKL